MFEGISPAGFVLVGGKSIRMGRDKALLPYSGRTLAQHVAEQVQKVANPVCFVGNAAVYGHFGLPVIPDAVANRGPLSGIEAALLSPFASEWNVIVACDLPRIDAQFLQALANAAFETDAQVDCVVPQTASGKLEPLYALYRKRCGLVAQQALAHGTRRVVDVVGMLQAEFWPVHDAISFQNVNTEPEWDQFLNDR